MNTIDFLKYKGAAILCSLIVFFGCTWILPVTPYIDVFIYAMLIFIVLTSVVYFLGERAIQTKQNNYFLYVAIINVFVKLVVSFVFMYIYMKVKEPSDNYFLVPFLLTYLIFTIFETYILSIQARSSK